MMSTAVRPAHNSEPTVLQSSQLVRYGVLIGGPAKIDLEGKGEFYTGHLNIPRRTLAEFVSIQVGRRNESEAALSDDHPSLHHDWHKNPDRIVTKSARECAADVSEMYGHRGFIVPNILSGVAFEHAVSLFDEVLPPVVRDTTLLDCIDHLNSHSFSGQAEDLRNDLLNAAGIARGWLSEHVRAIKGEMELAKGTGRGKRGLDLVDKEYFREIKEPLPAEEPALATLAMGKEIASAMNKQDSSKTDELLAALIEQNKLQAEANRLLMEKHTQAEPTVKAVAGTTKGSK